MKSIQLSDKDVKLIHNALLAYDQMLHSALDNYWPFLTDKKSRSELKVETVQCHRLTPKFGSYLEDEE